MSNKIIFGGPINNLSMGNVSVNLLLSLWKKNVDVLLAGPYIGFSKPNDSNYNRSFDNFCEKNEINLINYNNYEIVNKSFSVFMVALYKKTNIKKGAV